jgi:hypothetical protein
MLRDLYCSIPTLACYDGAADAGAAATATATGAAAGGATATATGAVAGDEPKFTQKQVNAFLAEERRKTEVHVKTQNKVLLEEKETRIAELLANSQLTTAEKERLQADYTKVQEDLKSYRTEKETILRERKASEDALNARAKELEDRAKSWESRYSDSTIKRELQEAAVKNNAWNADQLVALLRPNTKMVAVKDAAGQDTGEYTPVVEIDVTRDGKTAKTQLSPAKAVEYMKSVPAQYGNLFKSGAAGGTGTNNLPAGSPGMSSAIDLNNLTQAQYEAIRKDPAQSAAVFGRR